jgi:hypothetical protein
LSPVKSTVFLSCILQGRPGIGSSASLSEREAG